IARVLFHSSLHSVLHLSFYPYSSFFSAPSTTAIYTLSLHDALPILIELDDRDRRLRRDPVDPPDHEMIEHQIPDDEYDPAGEARSEEHTSELQSHLNLVCRLLLEKKKKKQKTT